MVKATPLMHGGDELLYFLVRPCVMGSIFMIRARFNNTLIEPLIIVGALRLIIFKKYKCTSYTLSYF